MISLDRAQGRQDRMRAALDDAGLEAEFVSAVDLLGTPEEELRAHCKSFGPWGVFAPGNMACTLSHAKSWKRFLKSDADIALILEDDVFLSPELRLWLQDLTWWPPTSDLVKIEHWRSKSLKVILGTPFSAHLGREIAPLLSRNPGAAAYLLTRRGAERLLAYKPFDMTIDALLFNPLVSRPAVDLAPCQVWPALSIQGNTPPDEDSFLGHLQRKATGPLYRKQKRIRGMAELRALPKQIIRLASGRARLVRVTHADRTITHDAKNAAVLANTA